MLKRIGTLLIIAIVILVSALVILTLGYGREFGGDRDINLDSLPTVSIDKAAEHLGQAIRFKTVSYEAGDPKVGQEGPWLAFQTWMETTYPEFHTAAIKERIPGGYTVLYTWRGSDDSLNPILLMAHQDVVPVKEGTEADWDIEPFSGAIENGYVYGRGTMDDKGSLVGILEAVNTLAKDGFKPQRTIHLLFGHDEEVSGSGAESTIAILKKRGVRPELVLDEGSMAFEKAPITGKPVVYISVAEKGVLTLDITATSKQGHSSMPPRNSAAVRLGEALIKLDKNQMPSHMNKPPISQMFEGLAGDLPFFKRMAFANQWLFGGFLDMQISQQPLANALVRTTTAPTMLFGSPTMNTLPLQATARVNFRVHPNDTPDSVYEHVKNVIRGIEDIEVKRTETRVNSVPASPISATDNLAFSVLSFVAKEVTNDATVVPMVLVGATDSRYAPAISESIYRFVPILISTDELNGFHGTNERISIENVERIVKSYIMIIKAMDTGR